MFRRWAVVPLVVLGCAASASGCKKKDAEKCDNALKVSRQAADTGDFALARQWREYAYKHCEDPASLQALDKDIVDKEKQLLEKKAAEEAKQREIDQLLTLFTQWAGQNKTSPQNAAGGVNCLGPEDSKERWCSGQRSVSGKYTFNVRYWEEEPEAAQFSTRAPGEVSCEKLGPASVLKTLSGGARSYCSLTGGALAGMQALLSRTPEGMVVAIFSPKYLERDAGLKAIVSQ